jgi:hypothetical protein
MPRRLTHVVTGNGAAILLTLYNSQGQPEPARIWEVFGGWAGGGLGGRLPDILDPAYRNPCHRGSAHSVVIAATGIKLLNEDLDHLQGRCRRWAEYCVERHKAAPPGSWEALLFFLAEKVCRFLAGFIAGLMVGYVLHLGMDACTDRSLALI